MFVVWFLTKGRHDTGAGDPARLRPVGSAIHFAWILVTGFFESLTRTHGLGALFVVVFLGALVVVVLRAGPQQRRDAAVPGVLLAAAALVALETGLGRADLLDQGTDKVRQGHYLFAVAVLTIPALAFVIEALVRYWRRRCAGRAVAMVLAIAVNAHRAAVEGRRLASGLPLRSEPRCCSFRGSRSRTWLPRSTEPFPGTSRHRSPWDG